MKYTIIVPVYNAEKYLYKCLKHLVNQTYKDIEIIIIDDGSKDNSYEICKKFENSDVRINLVKQENKGVSNARNQGIKMATGDYITFVDADDYIAYNTIEIINNIINKTETDILKYNYYSFYLIFKKKNKFSAETNEIISKDKYNQLYGNILLSNDFGSVCNAFIKKEIITKNKILFSDNLRYSEDRTFFVKCLYNSKKIYFLDKAKYYYRLNFNSAMHSKNYQNGIIKLSNYIESYNDIKKYIDNNQKTDKYIDAVKYAIEDFIINYSLFNDYKTYKLVIDKIFDLNVMMSKIELDEKNIVIIKNEFLLEDKFKKIKIKYRMRLLKEKIKRCISSKG